MTSQVDYTANGSIVAFPYPFAIPAKSALEVRINDVIQDVGFVITGAGSADGGNVVFGNAPAEGLAISLRYLGAVTITAQDATAGHLSDKLVAGVGISLETVTGAGGVQRLKLNADEAADALEKDQNLADLTDAAEARTNLGVYSKAETDARDQAVKDAALLKANNLSDLTDVTAARSNLGVYGKTEVDAKDQAVKDAALLKANNLSDLGDVAAARSNLGVYGKSEVDAKDQAVKDAALLKANNLSDLTDVAAARSNLGLAAISDFPLGSIILHSGVTPPPGYLIANGAAVARATYAQLDAAMYVGDADNATAAAWYRCTDPADVIGSRDTAGAYVVLPDYRGVMLRGLDLGRELDPDGASRLINSYQADETLAHTHPLTGRVSTTALTGAYTTGLPGDDNKPFYGEGGDTGSTGGTETRGKNAAVLICIKAFSAIANQGLIDITALANEVAGMVSYSALTGANQSLDTSGYQRLPGGLILQWGKSGPHSGQTARLVTLPLAAPSEVLWVSGQCNATEGIQGLVSGLAGKYGTSLTQIQTVVDYHTGSGTDADTPRYVNWIALVR